MTSFTRTKAIALLVVPSLVTLLLAAFCGIGYILGRVLGLPVRLGLPPPLRLAGLLVLAAGFGLQAWLFRHRRPMDVLVSTYETMAKSIRGAPRRGQARRDEPLILSGPHRHVRHPLYSAALLLAAGWWLVLDYTFLLFAAGFLFLWFRFVVTPFEEKELRALFGAEYESYARATPRFFPSIRRRGRTAKV
ncbi:MAG: hypothetical protein NTW86_15660 [Candidatus Sumerlaeota bacterium]|nr:hypothetical protein [Candidatus Sumerlaeota bacterium]